MECPKCGAPVVEKTTRNGRDLKECSTRKWDPTTKTTSGCEWLEWAKTERAPAPDAPADRKCPQCNGPMKIRTSFKGKFLGCSDYPKCKGIDEWDD